MSRKKILWLCSWYPNKVDRFNGDFIQRHAKSAAIYNDIHVIHVCEVYGDKLDLAIEPEINISGSLTEMIIYLKSNETLIGRIFSNYKQLRLYKKAIRKFISKNGNPDLIHVHIPMKAGLAGLWAKRKYETQLAVTEHWGIYNQVVSDNYYKRNSLFKRLTRNIIHAADIFCSVSKFLIQCVNQIIEIKKYRIIPNAVNTDLFTSSNDSDNTFRFIHVSNMVPLKNTKGLLRVYQEFSKEEQAELIMVGNMDNKMEGYAKGLGLSNVIFIGEVPYENVAQEMKKAHCLILFSDIENSPCVISEGLCCGLPIIATSVGGIPELIDESNGILVNPGNELELTEAMKKMVSEYSRFDRTSISKTARERYSYENIGKQFDELYSSLQARKT